MVLIKKYYFDLLMIKNVNSTLSVRVILYIQEFEVDITQRTKEKYVIKKNVNNHPKIVEKLKDFFYKYTIVILLFFYFLG